MAFLTIGFGLFSIIGGLIGFLKAGSKASLIAGGVSGMLLLLSTWAYTQGSIFGFYGLILISLMLGAHFGRKFLQSRQWMPAGIMLSLSVMTLVALVVEQLLKSPAQPL